MGRAASEPAQEMWAGHSGATCSSPSLPSLKKACLSHLPPKILACCKCWFFFFFKLSKLKELSALGEGEPSPQGRLVHLHHPPLLHLMLPACWPGAGPVQSSWMQSQGTTLQKRCVSEEVEGLPQTQIKRIHFSFGSTPGDAVGHKAVQSWGLFLQ